LAQQFSLSVVGPSHSVVVSGWHEQAGANFLILGLSFLIELSGSFNSVHRMQVWQAVNLSAGHYKRALSDRQYLHLADAAYREGDAGINAVTRTDQ
jgi:hypothetical protein